MVALSMADGYARLTSKPQAVIVHVDVGTQALAAAVHNASCGRAPVLIFAGLSPYTIEGEHRGSRTEYIHWVQDVPDQQAIVRQYCRYTGEIKTGKNVKQLVNRALSFAKSDPQGPVYLCGAREAMEMEFDPYTIDQAHWTPISKSGLNPHAASTIAQDLLTAKQPLIIAGYTGRNHATVPKLVQLADLLPSVRVLDCGGSDMCFPGSHPAWLGMRYGVHDAIGTADAILVVDCDVCWIPTQCRPDPKCVIHHIDVDPLKQQMPVFYIPALSRHRADAETALSQINQAIERLTAPTTASTNGAAVKVDDNARAEASAQRQREYDDRLSTIRSLAQPAADGTFHTSYLLSRLRALCPSNTIWCIEAVTNGGFVADQLQATIPGSWINCGGGGLGWSGGGTLGVKLAADSNDAPDALRGAFVCQVVGDGTYLFSVPGSVYWIAQRYGIPVLTIVLNNQGLSSYFPQHENLNSC
jgi:thiamine pyrophosphate-dependent acetolactate synthase large subunit-like protein